MTARVVDASIAAKWFLLEQWSVEASLLHEADDELIAPDLIVLELGRVILKKVRRGDLDEAGARSAFGFILQQPLRLFPMGGKLAANAFDIGLANGRDSYDSLYVALALHEDCTFVTADRVLYDALAPVYPETMVWVGDLPDVIESRSGQ